MEAADGSRLDGSRLRAGVFSVAHPFTMPESTTQFEVRLVDFRAVRVFRFSEIRLEIRAKFLRDSSQLTKGNLHHFLLDFWHQNLTLLFH